MDEKMRAEKEQLTRAVARLNSTLLGVMLGVMLAVGIFVATNWLVIKGGPVNASGREQIGPHLSLLGQFLIGYRVTFVGSIIGAVYFFVIGTIIGSVIGWLYNKLVDLRGL